MARLLCLGDWIVNMQTCMAAACDAPEDLVAGVAPALSGGPGQQQRRHHHHQPGHYLLYLYCRTEEVEREEGINIIGGIHF